MNKLILSLGKRDFILYNLRRMIDIVDNLKHVALNF